MNSSTNYAHAHADSYTHTHQALDAKKDQLESYHKTIVSQKTELEAKIQIITRYISCSVLHAYIPKKQN
jgi:hypothetical protein